MNGARKTKDARLHAFKSVFLRCAENAITEKTVCAYIIHNGDFFGLKKFVLKIPVILVTLTKSFTTDFPHATGSKKSIRLFHAQDYSRIEMSYIHCEVAKLEKVADKYVLELVSESLLHSLLSDVSKLVDSPWLCYQNLSDVLNGWLLPGTTGSQERISPGAKINESKQLGIEL